MRRFLKYYVARKVKINFNQNSWSIDEKPTLDRDRGVEMDRDVSLERESSCYN